MSNYRGLFVPLAFQPVVGVVIIGLTKGVAVYMKRQQAFVAMTPDEFQRRFNQVCPAIEVDTWVIWTRLHLNGTGADQARRWKGSQLQAAMNQAKSDLWAHLPKGCIDSQAKLIASRLMGQPRRTGPKGRVHVKVTTERKTRLGSDYKPHETFTADITEEDFEPAQQRSLVAMGL
jgi:hypothetical protein